MTFCLYVNQITPHLMPLAQEMLALLGEDNVRYVYVKALGAARSNLGWSSAAASWVINKNERPEEAANWLRTADILICERRDLDLWRQRIDSGKGMYYTCERWYKPFILGRMFGRDICLSGMLRLLHPGFFKMAWQVSQLFKSNQICYLADGVYAAQDFVKTLDLFKGRIFRMGKASNFKIEQRPLGRFEGHPNIRNWGYFVAPSKGDMTERKKSDAARKRVLWVGRFLHWKRLDTLVRACGSLPSVILDIYGAGPMESSIREMASRYANVHVFPPVPYVQVRELMRTYDIYVLPSNSWEGWGAVVNEALEENMSVLGSIESGASRTLLSEDSLFHCWDWKLLANMIEYSHKSGQIGAWSVHQAARSIYEHYKATH